MSAFEVLNDFLGTAQKSHRRMILVQGLLRSMTLGFGALLAAGLLEALLRPAPLFRSLLTGGLVLGAAVLLWRGVAAPVLSWDAGRTLRLLRKINSGLKDDLQNALELGRLPPDEPVSFPLIAAHQEHVLGLLPGLRVLEEGSREKLRERAVLLALMTLTFGVLTFLPPHLLRSPLSHLLQPWRSGDWEEHLSVSPGRASVPWGEPCEVTVRLLQASETEPELRIHMSSGWTRQAPERRTENEFFYSIPDVVEEVDYKVSWKNLSSPVYRLTPFQRPELGEFVYSYHYPSYTKLPPRDVSGGGPVTALRGTRVTVKAVSSAPLSEAFLVTDDGQRQPAQVRKTALEAELVVVKESAFHFELTDAEGRSATGAARIPIRVEEDGPPRVALLAPAMDLIVTPDEKLPLVFEAEDDFGVTRVNLVFEREGGGGGRERTVLRNWTESRLKVLEDHEWFLAPLHLKPGETVRYWVEALDSDSMSGPKVAVSESYRIEAKSFEREHELIVQGLKDFREDILKALSSQTLAKRDLENLKKTSPEDPARASGKEKLALEQERISKNMGESLQKLNRWLDRMRNDPLTDTAVFMEHEQIGRQLAGLAARELSRLPSELRNQAWDEALESEGRVTAELERMALLTEDVQQYERMQRLLDQAEKASRQGEDLARAVERAKNAPDREKTAALQEMMAQLNQAMQDLAQAMSRMPQELPEEFVNQQAVKNISMAGMQQAASRLEEALRRGDLDAALQAAQKMVQEMREMMKALQSAGESVPAFGGGQAAMPKALQESLEELEKIAQEQSALLAETDAVDKKRQAALSQEQEKLLGALAQKQAKALAAVQALVQKTQNFSEFPELYPFVMTSSARQVPAMERILEELKKKKITDSQKWLEDVSSGLRTVQDIAAKSKASAERETTPLAKDRVGYAAQVAAWSGEALTLEQEILEALRKGPEDHYSPSFEEKTKMESMGGRQEKLRGRTQGVRGKLQDMARRTAMLDSESLEQIRGAAEEMSQAGRSLNSGQSGPAMEHERSALEKLSSGQEGLSSGAQGMAQMQSGRGKPMAGFLQQRPGNGPGGQNGMRQGPVRIPRADEFVPPKEFREEILKSLKEKYPKSYDRIIRDYFKRLAE